MLVRDMLNSAKRRTKANQIEFSMTSKIEIIPIKCSVRFHRFDLARTILSEIHGANIRLQEEDIVVVSSKFAAVSGGRFVSLSKVKVTNQARKIAKKYHLTAELTQLVLSNSDYILGGVRGFLLAMADGILSPNAGIDQSNAPRGTAVLYPTNPGAFVKKLRSRLISLTVNQNGSRLAKLGVILSDSRVTPTRLGTVGVAIATAGIRPTIDMRGKEDLFYNKLKVTFIALADQLASAAELCMGEAQESTPVVIIRGVSKSFEKSKLMSENKMTISPDKCIVLSSLRNPAY